MQRRAFFSRLLGSVATAAVSMPGNPPVPAAPEPGPDIAWPCAYCGHPHTTPRALFPYVRFTLVCQGCGLYQNYDQHVRPFDPAPIRRY